ncbi:MAG: single-stranded DNA-binding protein [Tannerella sp.]|nr:single-stranded DNA-binding protein [Tannerella sp.]
MSLNKVILIGYVGKDPEVRYFESGNAVANFPLATSERGYKLANGTEIPERTEWHNIVANRDRAQLAEKYIKKGSLLYVEGKIRTRNYDDRDGNKRYVTEIYVDRIEFIGSGRRDEQQDGGNAAGAAANNSQAAAAEIPSVPDQTDDLPF